MDGDKIVIMLVWALLLFRLIIFPAYKIWKKRDKISENPSINWIKELAQETKVAHKEWKQKRKSKS